MPRDPKNMQNPHSWINYPNTPTRRCTRCGCIKKTSHINKTGESPITYELNGVVHDTYIPCISNQNNY